LPPKFPPVPFLDIETIKRLVPEGTISYRLFFHAILKTFDENLINNSVNAEADTVKKCKRYEK